MRPQLELSQKLTEQLDIRLGFNSLSDQRGVDLKGLRLDSANSHRLSGSALVDWQLPDTGLRLTGGALYGDLGWSTLDKAWAEGLPQYETIHSYSSLTSGNGGNPVKPYLGLGWDNDFGADGRFGLQLDLGLMFDGVTSTGPASGTGNDNASSDTSNLDQIREDTRLGEIFQSFRYSPMFSAGFKYRF